MRPQAHLDDFTSSVALSLVQLLAHRVISLRSGTWSLWGHSGLCADLPLAHPVANDPTLTFRSDADQGSILGAY